MPVSRFNPATSRSAPAPEPEPTPDPDAMTAAELAVILGSEEDEAERLLTVAVGLVERFAPDAPQAIRNEGIIRWRGLVVRIAGERGANGADRRDRDFVLARLDRRPSGIRGDVAAIALEGPPGRVAGMRLAARRFPDRIVRRRQGPGTRVAGRYVEGAVTETPLRASVQPVAVEDVLQEGGERLSDRRRIYVPGRSQLRAAADDSEADTVVIEGEAFAVVEAEAWRSYTRAVVLRVV